MPDETRSEKRPRSRRPSRGETVQGDFVSEEDVPEIPEFAPEASQGGLVWRPMPAAPPNRSAARAAESPDAGNELVWRAYPAPDGPDPAAKPAQVSGQSGLNWPPEKIRALVDGVVSDLTAHGVYNEIETEKKDPPAPRRPSSRARRRRKSPRGAAKPPQRLEIPPSISHAPQSHAPRRLPPEIGEGLYILAVLLSVMLAVTGAPYLLFNYTQVWQVCAAYGQQPFPFSLIGWYYATLFQAALFAVGLVRRGFDLLWQVPLLMVPVLLVLYGLLLAGMVTILRRIAARRGGQIAWVLCFMVLFPALVGWLLTVLAWASARW